MSCARRLLPALLLLLAPAVLRAQRVDLVVLIAVDQLRPDYLERWRPQLDGGLARLRARGTLFPDGAQDHALTETAPGHATILSGRVPAHTGIWSNDGGVEDPRFPLVGGPARDADDIPLGASPLRFRGTALADWLRAADPAVRVLGVSRKDRAAILPVGRSGPDVYWYRGGRFTTSTYYADTLPAWLRDWNARLDLGAFAGRAWPLARDAAAYPEPDDVPWENRGRDRVFPHSLPADPAALADALERVPWMDSLTLDVALAGVRARRLGRREGMRAPDLLTVSLSTTDAVGHDYGPDSREVHDHVLRLDRWLGAFLDALAAEVPAERTLFVLTADHGVLAMPERLAAEGRDAGRIDVSKVADSLAAALRARWGADFGVAFDNGLLTADAAALRARGADVAALAAAMARRVGALPGVRRTFTPRALAAAPAGDADAGPWRRSLPPDLGWLVAGVARPGWVFSDSRKAEHGTRHEESRRVPILFAGPGIAAGRTDARRVRTVDIAPTLAARLGIRPTERLDGVVITGLADAHP
jgi:arylsulfatase A-like enzyme